MYPATRAAKVNPASNVGKWLTTSLTEFAPFVEFVGSITEEQLTGFWGRRTLFYPFGESVLTALDARSQFILCCNFLIYLFLLATAPGDVETAYRLLESFHESLRRLGRTEQVAARLMLRPAILRIDSFFTQATELIRNGRSEAVHSPALT